jgi:hypothetical protein
MTIQSTPLSLMATQQLQDLQYRISATAETELPQMPEINGDEPPEEINAAFKAASQVINALNSKVISLSNAAVELASKLIEADYSYQSLKRDVEKLDALTTTGGPAFDNAVTYALQSPSVQQQIITISPDVAYMGTLTYPIYGNGGDARGLAAVDWQYNRGSSTQVASGYAATISGGVNNTASNNYATVGGGLQNSCSSKYGVIGGGNQNTASSTYFIASQTIAGGYQCSVTEPFTTIGGGYLNTASGFYATVIGGDQCTASGAWSIAGGSGTASGDNSLALLGDATADGALAIGGTASGAGSLALQGGTASKASSFAAMSGTVTASSGIAIGPNTTSAYYGISAGGAGSTASGEYSGTFAGLGCTASGDYAAVIGGRANVASGDYSCVYGGNSSNATGSYATVAGGYDHDATGDYSIVAGGFGNDATGDYSFAAGNTCIAAASYSFSMGSLAYVQAAHSQSFVLGYNATSTQSDEMILAFANGVYTRDGSVNRRVADGGGTTGTHVVYSGDTLNTVTLRINGTLYTLLRP